MWHVLFLAAATAVALPHRASNSSEKSGSNFEIVNSAASIAQCYDEFVNYQGWCVHVKNGNNYKYQDAVDECTRVGAFAPSIHSESDLNFWKNAIDPLEIDPRHFWLNAYCPSNGQNYAWFDGTSTNYFGPSNQLTNCQMSYGFHLESTGLSNQPYTAPAPALCAYPLSSDHSTPKPMTTSTTVRATTTYYIPPTTTLKSTTNTVKASTSTTTPTTPTIKSTTQGPIIDVPSEYCSCNPSTVYLDIVFVVDTSDDMTRGLVGDATAAIQSTLYGLTFGTGKFQSNVAVIAFAETVQTAVNFGGFKSTKDISHFSLPYLGGNPSEMAEAITQASSMIYSNGRDFTRGVIVLLTNSFDQRHAANIDDAAKAFKDDDGIIITIDYSAGLGIQGLEDISSPGFYINDTSTNPDLDADVLYALCDANCFCKDGLSVYNVANERSHTVPNGCYHVSGFSAVYDAADDNCQNMDGFVATIHDDNKNFFMISLFPPKSRYWIGLRNNGSNYEWADGSNDKTTYWAPGNPVAGQDCVYGQQQTGFNSPWFSAPCTDPLKNSMPYACQLRPCGSDYDCWN